MDTCEEKEFISVKEYAALHHVSESSVYAKMRRKKKHLDNHIKKIKGVTFLDEYAQRILKPREINTELAKKADSLQDKVYYLSSEVERLMKKCSGLEADISEKDALISVLQESQSLRSEHEKIITDIAAKLDEIFAVIKEHIRHIRQNAKLRHLTMFRKICSSSEDLDIS